MRRENMKHKDTDTDGASERDALGSCHAAVIEREAQGVERRGYASPSYGIACGSVIISDTVRRGHLCSVERGKRDARAAWCAWSA